MELRRDGIHAMWCAPDTCKTGFQQQRARRRSRRSGVLQRRDGSPSPPEECAQRHPPRRGARRPHGRDARARDGCWSCAERLFPGAGRSADGGQMNGTGMNLKLKRTPGIYLVGFMAPARPRSGGIWPHRLGWNFFDIDTRSRPPRRPPSPRSSTRAARPSSAASKADILRQHVRWIERGRPTVVALGRRRVRAAGESRAAGGQRRDASGSTARSKPCSGGSAQASAPAAGARPREVRRAVRRARARCLRAAPIPRRHRERRSRSAVDAILAAPALPMSTTHAAPSRPRDLPRGAGRRRSRRRRGAPPGTRANYDRYPQHLGGGRGEGGRVHGARPPSASSDADRRRPGQRQGRPHRQTAPHRAERVRPSGARRARRGGRAPHRGDRRGRRARTTWCSA